MLERDVEQRQGLPVDDPDDGVPSASDRSVGERLAVLSSQGRGAGQAGMVLDGRDGTDCGVGVLIAR